MRSLYIFDMDDTLIDSREATRAAYQQAAKQLGLPLPEHFWGRTAGEWKCPPELHALKVKLYATMLDNIRPGWAWETFMEAIRNRDTCHIWTGASFATVSVLGRHPVFGIYLSRTKCGMTTEDKRVELLRLRAFTHTQREIHYYDDNDILADRICQDIPLVFIHTKGAVHNAGDHPSRR